MKRGQLQISFGMIFSIIIIIALLATTVYVLLAFLSNRDCALTGLYYDSLQKEIDRAWRSPIYSGFFNESLPGDITRICFGNLSSGSTVREFNEIDAYILGTEDNVFLYPPAEACEKNYASKRLAHVADSAFFCVPVQNGRASLRLSKERNEALVRISR